LINTNNGIVVTKVKLHAKVNFKDIVNPQALWDRLGYTISKNKVFRHGDHLKGLKDSPMVNIPIVSPSGKNNTISKKRPIE
jgi:hypothetical protein